MVIVVKVTVIGDTRHCGYHSNKHEGGGLVYKASSKIRYSINWNDTRWTRASAAESVNFDQIDW